MPPICNICQSSVQMWDNYTHIYTSYKLIVINNVTRNLGIHVCHITVICSWTNKPATLHTMFLVWSTYRSHITTYFHQNQWTATSIYHTTAKYVPSTYMHLKCHIYAICPYYLMCINEVSMPIYVPHINSLASTMWQVVLYTDSNTTNADTNNNADSNANNDDDNTAKLHKLSWPLVNGNGNVTVS